MLLSGGAGMHDTGQVCPGPQVWHTSPSATWAHLCVGLCPQVPMSICIGWKEHRTRSPEAHLLDLTIPLTVGRPWALDLPPPGSHPGHFRSPQQSRLQCLGTPHQYSHLLSQDEPRCITLRGLRSPELLPVLPLLLPTCSDPKLQR